MCPAGRGSDLGSRGVAGCGNGQRASPLKEKEKVLYAHEVRKQNCEAETTNTFCHQHLNAVITYSRANVGCSRPSRCITHKQFCFPMLASNANQL